MVENLSVVIALGEGLHCIGETFLAYKLDWLVWDQLQSNKADDIFDQE